MSSVRQTILLKATSSCKEIPGRRAVVKEKHRFSFAPKIPERDRVPQPIQRRDAVFPLGPRRAAEQVSGARLGDDVGAFPRVALLSPKAEVARREERDAHDLVEHRL